MGRRAAARTCIARRTPADVVLTDGGVYDNLGLETAWKRYDTILVSDGGGKMRGRSDEPQADWARHAHPHQRDHRQPGAQPARASGDRSFKPGDREGTYWGIRTDIADYGRRPARCRARSTQTTCWPRRTTRLKQTDGRAQERLINWGYAVCDAGMRRWVEPGAAAPGGFPYSGRAVG